ncbi:replication restart helicase PriA [Stratiformator vulcanicus]|uniref:Replication restart protein PriA n=1 Tax=Stratiformator vulcanicus TaxID=2527980 RepID=A0A517QYS8_9PLAN|nr:primosomal protein N' [Stratiformator vulcanicus]QDT36792.1 Primosomal protein N' [Stratiformator vulcanicus]
MNTEKQQGLFDEGTPLPGPMPWEEAAVEDVLIAEIALNKPLDDQYSYIVPDPLRERIRTGGRVRVPFGRGNRFEYGFVTALKTAADYRGNGTSQGVPKRLKSIESLVDEEPLIESQMLQLTKWIADYYLCGWGQVLHSVVPAGVRRGAGTRLETFVALTPEGEQALATHSLGRKQRAVAEILKSRNEPVLATEVAAAADCGTGPIRELERKGFVERLKIRSEVELAAAANVDKTEEFHPTAEQAASLEKILGTIQSGEHRTILLHGVTGSGKTEVYIRAIEEVVSYGRQAIVLVPEISLTPQTIRRFRRRFDSVAVLHSHLNDADRHAHWKRIKSGDVQVVVGARSAIFAPTPRLGLVVIDEEHETSFKQDTTPRYHAREVAEQRTRFAGVPLVLGSATPTLESWHAAKTGRYDLVSMRKRVGNLEMPPVTVVDIRNDPQVRKGQAIGRILTSSIRSALEEGSDEQPGDGQVILFLNLRGFSPAVWCPACGSSLRCDDCDITMTWHRDIRRVLCHSCAREADVPKACPSCGHQGWKFVGAGTQKLEDEVRAKFPEYSLARMDSDSMKRPGSHDEVLSAFRDGKIRILLGTQMIAKGLDFPNVTLVGVIDADTLLHQPDLRSSERTFQLIAQVAGRTGRSHRGGRVLVQSANPADPAIRRAAEHDYLAFSASEMQDREVMAAPPFRHYARVILRGEVESDVKRAARALADRIRQCSDAGGTGVSVLGPAPAPISKLRKLHRFHLQLAATESESLRALWRRVEADMPRTPGVELAIDVDPINMR